MVWLYLSTLVDIGRHRNVMNEEIFTLCQSASHDARNFYNRHFLLQMEFSVSFPFRVNSKLNFHA
jgi:hypothetical protein